MRVNNIVCPMSLQKDSVVPTCSNCDPGKPQYDHTLQAKDAGKGGKGGRSFSGAVFGKAEQSVGKSERLIVIRGRF